MGKIVEYYNIALPTMIEKYGKEEKMKNLIDSLEEVNKKIKVRESINKVNDLEAMKNIEVNLNNMITTTNNTIITKYKTNEGSTESDNLLFKKDSSNLLLFKKDFITSPRQGTFTF
jgi:hypothetical protein